MAISRVQISQFADENGEITCADEMAISRVQITRANLTFSLKKTAISRVQIKIFRQIDRFLNDFRLWTFQKSAAGAAEVTDNEAAPAPLPLTHGVITGPITQVANLRFFH